MCFLIGAYIAIWWVVGYIVHDSWIGLATSTIVFVIGFKIVKYIATKPSNNSSSKSNRNDSSNTTTQPAVSSQPSQASPSTIQTSSSNSGSRFDALYNGYDQSRVYAVDYGDRCRVCYYKRYNESHKCAGIIRAERKVDKNTGAETYNGQLYDGLNLLKWSCDHNHDNASLANKCAVDHYMLHRRGVCNCAYFAQAKPHWLGAKTSAQLYIVKNDRLQAWKVGVSGNTTNNRLQEHLDNGWKLVARWNSISGNKAYENEQRIIGSWRKQGFPIAVSYKNMPQSGATETVSMSNVSIEDIEVLITELTGLLKYKPLRG